MEEFLAKNYIWFLILAIMFIFALIGYIIEQNKNKPKSQKDIEIEKEIENLESITDPNATLGDVIGNKEEKIEINLEPVNLNIEQESKSDLIEEEDPTKMIIDEPDA